MPVIALGNILHNGTFYEKGSTIPQIAKKDEERLLNLGVAEKQVTSKANKVEE